MKIYGVLLILLVILMGCSQQTSNEELDEKPVEDKIKDNNTGKEGETKDNNAGKEGEIKDNNAGKEGEIKDNNTGKEGETKDNDDGEEDNSGDGVDETCYSTLEKKVNKLRGKHERAKNKFKEAGHPFPNEEELSNLFPNIQDPEERTKKIFLEKQYSFANIVKLISQATRKFPGRMDDTYAGLEYDAGLLTELDKIIPKLNHKGQINEPYAFYDYFLNRIGAAGEFNRKVLYEYLNDATLAKLKSGSAEDIAKANKLLDEFMKKKADLVGLFKAQIKEVEKQKQRNDFYIKVIEARREEIVDAYHDLKKSSENIKEFCLELNK
ncbi:hypothetical protein DB313_04930 (plasmid) [Borrelia turcica IST7]|uniref:Uncharacterized protein n=1 Tax=Borrelia turcica IST7 TaxID=1104446 RepID=A0A386PP28_9SPIR|nr:hypothetical protein [Borrelia turcica]AYE36845.1 hypothetical protein DB313_04930 [Borrelia turcica IST7]